MPPQTDINGYLKLILLLKISFQPFILVSFEINDTEALKTVFQYFNLKLLGNVLVKTKPELNCSFLC